MSNKRDLLKEAIADAKTVKETAIKNAKASLEESFTPHLKSMLSAKLQEMEDDDGSDDAETTSESQENQNEDNIDEGETDEDVNLNEVEDDDTEENVEDVIDDEGEGDDNEEMSSEEDEELDIEDMSEEDLTKFIEDIISDMVENGEIEPNSEDEGDVEDVEIEDNDDEVEEEEDLNEDGFSGNYEDDTAEATGGLDNIIQDLQALVKKGGPMAKKAYKALEDLGSAAGQAMRNESEYEDEDLDEALKTINSLKGELKEVNLLNAKLLYTNKIFKNKSLTESNKMEVLKSFDKAETTKQAKMIYETLNSSMKFNSTSKRKPKKFKSQASKASGITESQVRKPIVKNDAFDRMKELAFHNTNK